MNVFDLAASLTLNKDGYESGLVEAESSAGSAGSRIGSALKTAGTVVATGLAAASAAVVALGKNALTAGSEFETSFAKVQTIMDTTQMNAQSMSDGLLRLSNAMGISTSELSDTVYNVISATGDTANALSIAESASKLATAGFTDSSSALSVLTTAMNAYGLSADKVNDISDSLITVQNLGVTTVADLSAGMGKAIASASAYGVDLGNVESAYISMTKAGINTAESTTYMSSMMKELGDSGSTVGTVLKEQTGKSFSELMSDGKSLGDVLQILQDSVDGDSTALMNLWSSAEAGKASNAIVSQGLDEFNSNLQAVSSSAGATEKAFTTMSETLSVKLGKVSNSWTNLLAGITDDNADFDSLVSQFADSVGSAAESLIPRISTTLQGISKLVTELAPMIVQMLPGLMDSILPGIVSGIQGLLSAVVSVLPGLLSSLTSILPSLISTCVELFAQLVSNLSAILEPILQAIPTIITSVLTAILENLPMIVQGLCDLVLMVANNIPLIIKSLIESLPLIIESVVTGLISCVGQLVVGAIELVAMLLMHLPEIIIGLIKAIPQIISAIIEGLKNSIGPLIESVGGHLSDIWDDICEWFTDLIDDIGQWISDIWNDISEWFTGLISDLTQWGLDIYNDVNTWIEDRIEDITTFFSDIWDAITGFFTETIPEIVEDLAEIAQDILDWIDERNEEIAEFFSGIWDAITGFFTETIPEVVRQLGEIAKDIGQWISERIQSIGQFFSEIWGSITGFFGGLISSIGQWISGIASTISTWFSQRVAAVGQFFSGIWQSITGFFSNLIKGVGQWFSNILKSVGEFVASIPRKISEGISTVKEVGLNLVKGLWNGISDAASWVLEKIKGFGKTILNGIKSIFGIASPSKKTAEFGKFIAQGLALGIEDHAGEAISAMESMSEGIMDAAPDLATEFTATAKVRASVSSNSAEGRVYGLLEKYLPQLANMQMTIDGKTLIGTLSGEIDSTLGRRRTAVARGIS